MEWQIQMSHLTLAKITNLTQSISKAVEELEPADIANGRADWYSHSRK